MIGADNEVVVLVPTEQVLLLKARVNARSAAQRAQAVPYAVEDQILGAIEDQHFAWQVETDGDLGIAVVARDVLRGWLDRLAAAGLKPDRLLPEALALPVTAPTAMAMIDGGTLSLRLDAWSALATTLDEFPAWLAALRSSGLAEALEVHAFGPAAGFDASLATAGLHAGKSDPLAFLARHIDATGINLLSGEFAAPHRRSRATRLWRRVAVLAAAVVLAAFAHRALEVRQMSATLDRIDAGMADLVARSFPDLGAAERQRSPQAVMQERLERLRGGGETSGMLALLGQVAPFIGRTTRSQLRGLEYRNGVLEVGLRSPDVATLDSLREQFAALPGISAEVTASVPLDTGVDGRIRIQAVKP